MTKQRGSTSKRGKPEAHEVPPGGYSLERDERRERADQHRALLLYAMQDPGSNPGGADGGRSVRLVATTIDRSPSIVRKWAKAKRWSERIEAHGETAQEYAIAIYRARYMAKFGRRDLAEIGAVISLPVLADAPTEVQQDAAHRLSGMAPAKLLPPDPPAELQAEAQNVLDNLRQRAVTLNGNLRDIGLSAIEVVRLQLAMVLHPGSEDAQKAAAAGLRAPNVKLSDLPRLQRMLRDLSDEERRLRDPGAAAAEGAGRAMVDSVRVSIVKAKGGTSREILEAVAQDLADARVMVEQLLSPDLTVADIEAENAATEPGA